MKTNFDKIIINLGLLKIKDLKADPSLIYRIKIKNLYDAIINNIDDFVEILNSILLDRIHIEINGGFVHFEKDRYYARYTYSSSDLSLIPNTPIIKWNAHSYTIIYESKGILLEIFRYNLVDIFWILGQYDFNEQEIEKLFGEFAKKMKPNDKFIVEKSINFVKDLTKMVENDDIKAAKYYIDNFPNKKITNTQASKITFPIKIYEFCYTNPSHTYYRNGYGANGLACTGTNTNAISYDTLMRNDIGKYVAQIKGWEKVEKSCRFIIPNISSQPRIKNDDKIISIFKWIGYHEISNEKYDIINILLDKSLIKMNKSVCKNLMYTKSKNRDRRKLLIKLLNYGSENIDAIDNLKNNSGILTNEEFIRALNHDSKLNDEFMKDNRQCDIAKIRVSTTGNIWGDCARLINDISHSKNMPTIGGKPILYYVIDNENNENFNYNKTFYEIWRRVKNLDDDAMKYNGYNVLEHIINKLREYQYIPYADKIFKCVINEKPQFITEYLMGELQMYNMQPFLKIVKNHTLNIDDDLSSDESSSSDD